MCLNGHAAQASLLMESEMTKAHVIYKITNFIDKIKGIDHKIAILRRQKLDCHECTLDHTLPFVRFVCGCHCPSPAWRGAFALGRIHPDDCMENVCPLGFGCAFRRRCGHCHDEGCALEVWHRARRGMVHAKPRDVDRGKWHACLADGGAGRRRHGLEFLPQYV